MPGQTFVLTPYPFAPCNTLPPEELLKVTGAGLPDVLAGAPIAPTVEPFIATSCRMAEVPLIVPTTDAVERQGYPSKFRVPETVALLAPILDP